eukprot:gene16008-biopygen6297
MEIPRSPSNPSEASTCNVGRRRKTSGRRREDIGKTLKRRHAPEPQKPEKRRKNFGRTSGRRWHGSRRFSARSDPARGADAWHGETLRKRQARNTSEWRRGNVGETSEERWGNVGKRRRRATPRHTAPPARPCRNEQRQRGPARSAPGFCWIPVSGFHSFLMKSFQSAPRKIKSAMAYGKRWVFGGESVDKRWGEGVFLRNPGQGVVRWESPVMGFAPADRRGRPDMLPGRHHSSDLIGSRRSDGCVASCVDPDPAVAAAVGQRVAPPAWGRAAASGEVRELLLVRPAPRAARGGERGGEAPEGARPARELGPRGGVAGGFGRLGHESRAAARPHAGHSRDRGTV